VVEKMMRAGWRAVIRMAGLDDRVSDKDDKGGV
jgi:hypothetical protein